MLHAHAAAKNLILNIEFGILESKSITFRDINFKTALKAFVPKFRNAIQSAMTMCPSHSGVNYIPSRVIGKWIEG
jgi:hypothetical protein